MSFFYLAGILVVGGWPWPTGASSLSVEFWSEANRKQESCFLEDYPRAMFGGPTVNLVSGRLVACFEHTCEIYEEGSWKHLQNTSVTRKDHSSATTKDAVLLIGGEPNGFQWMGNLRYKI